MTDAKLLPRACIAVLLAGLAGCASRPVQPASRGPDSADAALAAELASIRQPLRSGAAPAAKPSGDAAAMAQEAARARDAAALLVPPPAVYLPLRAAEVQEPHFDLSVNNAPIKEVLMSIVNGTRYSMVVHPEVSGTISLDLKETTVPEVLDVLRELYGYQFQLRGARIMVESGRIETRIFNVNYLSLTRSGKSEVRVTSGSLSSPNGAGAGSSGGGGQSTTSAPVPQGSVSAQESSRVTTTLQNDLWQDLAATLKMIIGGGENRQVMVSAPTGMVAVRAMPRELSAVAQYLKALGVNIGRQVMLEAKIIDVELSDSQQEGINWAAFRTGSGGRFSLGQVSPGTLLQPNGALATGGTAVDAIAGTVSNPAVAATVGGNFAVDPRVGGSLLGLAFQTSNFAALISFLETQGKVQVLSSPRIATINNQKAVLKVGTDDFFVTNVTTTTVTSGSGSTSSPTVTVQPFFSGIALDVTAQIDEQDNVTLHVHPQVSDVTEKDKVVTLGQAGTLTLPLASSSVSETDSIVRIANSNIAAIGGLMSRRDTVARSGIPGVSEGSLFGRLFGQRASAMTKRELVILIKPTVIHEASDWEPITSDDTMRLKASIGLSVGELPQ